jgi:DNA-binding XRE family transcriptional regulator
MQDMITIPRSEYEDLVDASDAARVIARLEVGQDELIPAEFANRLIDGESPVKVWREIRGMTQMQLANASSVNRVQISNIESGAKTGSIETVKKLAFALEVSMDDLS